MTDPMRAEFEIRQLQARYADALWHKDAENFAALFARDAVWKVAGMRLEGRDTIRETFAKFMVHLDRCLMTFRNPIVDIVDGVITSRTYVTEQNKFADGQTAATLGIYYERFAEEDGRLRFAYRHWNMYYIGPADLSADFYDVREFGPPPGFPGPDDPTTVRSNFLFTGADGQASAEP